jgi:hypothetical protein
MDSETSAQRRTNQYYIAQLNSMEIKISELRAQLQAKDFEIDYLSNKFSAFESPSAFKELELKLSKALDENESLKKLLPSYDQVVILQSQLEQALHMKDLFEQKYRELKTQAMVNEKLENLLREKEEKIKKLTLNLDVEQRKRMEIEERLKKTGSEQRVLKDDNFETFRPPSELKERRTGRENDRGSRNYSINFTRKFSKDSKSIEETQKIRKNLLFQSSRII